jgi:hypothetical protein
MAKSDQPTSTQDNPISSSDKSVKTGKNDRVELTADELKKVSGGITNPGTLSGHGG